MKKLLFNLRALMLLLLMMVGVSSVWAEEAVYKTALFGSSYNSQSVSSYSNSWFSTNNGFTVNLENWNNNNNGWSYIKAGHKNSAYVGTITTAAAIDKAVTKVVVTIDAITAANVTSIKLYSGDEANGCTTELGSFDKSTGAKAIVISSPTANKFYKIAFDCIAKANGCVQVSKVEYYYDNAGNSTPANPYTVTFDAGSNGDCSTTSLTEESAGAGVTLPSVTPNSGYRFKGWSTTELTYTAATLTNGVFKPTANCTLYAFYDREYTAKFYVNGAQSGETQNLIEGETIVFPADPTVDGVTFMGWATVAIDGTQNDAPTMYKSATMGTNNVEYYAVFANVKGSSTTETFGWEEATTPSNWEIGGTFTRTEANASYSANSGSYYGLTNSNSSVQFKNKVKVKSFSYYCVRRTTNTNTSIKIETSTNGTSWTEALSTTWNTFNSDGKTYKKIEKEWDEPIECYVRVNLVTAANRQLDDISITYEGEIVTDYCTTVPAAKTPTSLSWSSATATATIGESNSFPTLTTVPGNLVGVTYNSSNTSVATIANTGEIALVAAGETTITASYAGNETYAAAKDATYTLTVKVTQPTHSVMFYVNGQQLGETQSVEEGEPISFPADPSDIGGKKFVGWVTFPIDGFMQDKPELISQANMGTSDVNYYAVFALHNINEESEVLDNNEIAGLSSLKALSYTTEKTYRGSRLGYSIYGYTDNTSRKWIQLKKDRNVYIKITAPGNVSKVEVTITNTSNLSGGINDISKHNAYSGYVGLVISDCAFADNSENIGITNIITDNIAIIESNKSSKEVYLKVSVGARIWRITTNFDVDSYSDYCTTVNFFSATIAECGYTSVCLPYNAKIVEDGAQAYALTEVTDCALNFAPVEVMNKEKGYLIKGTKQEVYTMLETSDTPDDMPTILDGVTERTERTSMEFVGKDEYCYPWLLMKDGTFKKYTGTYIPANKAYLDGYFVQQYVNSLGDASSASLRVVFEETEQTGLETMTEIGKGENFVYNLTGKKVQAVSKSGLYIVNGKKVVIK